MREPTEAEAGAGRHGGGDPVIMVTAREQDQARTWLARRGRPVGRPTPLATALIATRNPVRAAGHGILRYVGYLLLGQVAGGGYSLLFGRGMTESVPVYFLYFGMQLAMWDTIRRAERDLGHSVSPVAPAEPWWRVLGGWYIASLVLAFAGGTALALTIFFTTPARTYAVSWLGLLVLSALCTAWILIGVLRGPLLAADAGSLAIARALRAEKIYYASPMLTVIPLVLDLLLENRETPAFEPWLVAYVLAVLVLQGISIVVHRHRYRTLPPGHYGDPLPRGTDVDWSPPEAR